MPTPILYPVLAPTESLLRIVRGGSTPDNGTGSIVTPTSPGNDSSLNGYGNLGQILNEYILSTEHYYLQAETTLHHFSAATFNSAANNNGVLRKVNIYMGIQGYMHFDIENPSSSAVHAYYGSWSFNGEQLAGPSYSEMDVFYGDEAESLCFKRHEWPDQQADLVANPYTPPAPSGNFSGPDACLYYHQCDETQVLRASITDPTKLAAWSDSSGLIALSYRPFHKRYIHPILWGDGTNVSYFSSTRHTDSYFTVELLYSW